MGRKNLYMIRTHIQMPSDMLEKIDEVVGQKGRSKFIREAVGEKLKLPAEIIKPLSERK